MTLKVKNKRLTHEQFIKAYAIPAGRMIQVFKKHRDAYKRFYIFARYNPKVFNKINVTGKPFIWKGDNCIIMHGLYWQYLWMQYRIIRNNIVGIENRIIEIQLIKLKNEKRMS